MIDNKEYARQLRANAAKDENGVIRCSPELWEEIARIIENSDCGAKMDGGNDGKSI